jgi:hypothetical protein
MRIASWLSLIPLSAALALCGMPPHSAAQQAAPATTAPAPTIDILAYTEYPSMLPVTAIRVHLSSSAGMRDLVDAAIAKGWDCTKISSYTVAIKGSKRKVAIANLRLEPGSTCAVGQVEPNAILVLTDHSLTTKDLLQVSLANLPNPLVATPSRAKAFPKPTNSYALTLTPQAAPGEALTSGAKRTVGQLSVAFTNPQILDSTDLFSTDERDSKSAFSGVFGAKRGLFSSWYTPISLQESLQGNQNATSLSAVTTLAFSSISPWAWNKTILYNGAIKAPSPPEFTINASYTRRITQTVTAATPLLAVNDLSLNPAASFTPIYLLPKACEALQKKLGNTTTPPTSKQYCLGLQTDLGLWYLPSDLTKNGSQRAEGYGDISILIPLSDIPFKSLGYLVTGSTANTQLRIKYSDSVNAANSYARCRQWTYGFEVIK